MMRKAAAIAAALLALAGAAAAAPTHEAARATGLTAPARIVVDRWGIPHIYAASARDAYFVQGWNVARDRLWEIDLWRKRGLGLLSASFGPAYVEQDRAARLLLYRGDMDAEWASYGPEMKSDTEAFVAGIDAYVGEVLAGRRPLPLEFGLTGSKPDLWAAQDVVRVRSHALVSNLLSEVARARVACAAGLPADRLRRRLEPPHETKVPDGLDPCLVTVDVLKDYVRGTQPVAFSAAEHKLAFLPLDRFEQAAAAEGSNNWVVAASRTATGRPLLANDPHRQIVAPSLRYIAHLNAPGLDLIGAGEPSFPGVSIGHNESGAFGFTIFAIDQEDLYVYDLDPADPNRYRYKAGWEPMRIVREEIPVKGEAPRVVELRFTRHGPVLQYDPAHGHAFALRTVWMEPGAAGYLDGNWFAHAADWAGFQTARSHYVAPPENFVWADVHGTTGWGAAGLTPRRPNWDGLMPVPGDGRYEWAGFLPGDELPTIENPAKGWFASANAMNLPANYPNEDRKVSFEWSDRSRLDRIEEVLGANAHVSVANSMTLQTDSTNAIARRALALLRPLTSDEPRMKAALARLAAWDRNEGTASVAAAIYEVWTQKHLGKALAARAAPAAAPIIGNGSLDASLSVLERPEGLLGDNPDRARREILQASLAAALEELTARLGPDMSRWTWGSLHHSTQAPPAAVLAEPAERARLTAGPTPISGGPNTPRAGAYDLQTFNVIAGASVRMVLDVGAWDNSRIVNTPGQSADPASPHFGDLFPLWASGRYVPLLYSRRAVEKAADHIIDLTP